MSASGYPDPQRTCPESGTLWLCASQTWHINTQCDHLHTDNLITFSSTFVTLYGHPEVSDLPCGWSEISMEDETQTFFELNKGLLKHARDKILSLIQSVKCWTMNLKRSSIFSKTPAMSNTLDIRRRQRLQMKHNVAGNHISWHFSSTTIYQGLQGTTLICPCPGNWIIMEYFEERLFLMAKHLFYEEKYQ